MSLTTWTNFKSKSLETFSGAGRSFDRTVVNSNVTKIAANTAIANTRQTITSFPLEGRLESGNKNARDSFIYTRSLIFRITLKTKQQNQLFVLLVSFDLSGENWKKLINI